MQMQQLEEMERRLESMKEKDLCGFRVRDRLRYRLQCVKEGKDDPGKEAVLPDNCQPRDDI